jgi:hypothetical protein
MAINKDDQRIVTTITNKLATRGIRAPCSVVVTCHMGAVTITGTVIQPHQKGTAKQLAQGVEGVKRVNEMLIVKNIAKRSESSEWAVKPTKAEIAAAAQAPPAEPLGLPVE